MLLRFKLRHKFSQKQTIEYMYIDRCIKGLKELYENNDANDARENGISRVMLDF